MRVFDSVVALGAAVLAWCFVVILFTHAHPIDRLSLALVLSHLMCTMVAVGYLSDHLFQQHWDTTTPHVPTAALAAALVPTIVWLILWPADGATTWLTRALFFVTFGCLAFFATLAVRVFGE
jgi:hypothetical protein